jgi:esterase
VSDPPALALRAIRHDAAGGGALRSPLLIVHGLFGSARNWGAVARRLAADRTVLVPDLRNHGDSPWDARHDYPALAADLAALIEAEGAPMDVAGHSMGGKAAMVLALSRPDLVRRLAVLDIAPVAYPRDRMAEIEAMRRVDPAQVASRADAAAAMGLDDPATAAFLIQSLDLPGRRWRLNLDALAANMEAIMGFPAVGGAFAGPALLLSGEDSDYVQPAHRPAIRALFPAARFVRLRGAGHWLHADRPRETEGALRAFLDAPEGAQRSDTSATLSS